MDVVYWLCVFLLVMNEGGAVRAGPAALVALVRVLARVTPPVIYQVVRPLEFLPTEVTSVPKLWSVHQLVLL